MRNICRTLAIAAVLAGCNTSAGPRASTNPTDTTLVVSAGPMNSTLSRGDVDCTETGLGTDDQTTFKVAYLVVDGTLGQLCFGNESKTLLTAWNLLAALTPPERLNNLSLFAGFAPGKKAKKDDPTYAFVNAANDAGTAFQMSVNIPEAENDKREFQLTMAHEFSHVITSTPDQIERGAPTCGTYANGEGCFRPGSFLADWVTQFWGGGLIEQVDPKVDPTPDIGAPRCKTNASFLNEYAASNPEEDLSESFAAFVFRVPLSPSLQPKMAFFAARPELAAFRDRAILSGLSALPDSGDHCGS